MNTDRDLLELAAKAAGVEIKGWTETRYGTEAVVGFDRYTVETWNPLTDDGDALRLAVKLHLDINQFPVTDDYIGMVEIQSSGDDDPVHVEYVRSEDGRLAATRHAIVSAAAEIGRKMQEGGAA